MLGQEGHIQQRCKRFPVRRVSAGSTKTTYRAIRGSISHPLPFWLTAVVIRAIFRRERVVWHLQNTRPIIQASSPVTHVALVFRFHACLLAGHQSGQDSKSYIRLYETMTTGPRTTTPLCSLQQHPFSNRNSPRHIPHGSSSSLMRIPPAGQTLHEGLQAVSGRSAAVTGNAG